jgi:hypothetical protein
MQKEGLLRLVRVFLPWRAACESQALVNEVNCDGFITIRSHPNMSVVSMKKIVASKYVKTRYPRSNQLDLDEFDLVTVPREGAHNGTGCSVCRTLGVLMCHSILAKGEEGRLPEPLDPDRIVEDLTGEDGSALLSLHLLPRVADDQSLKPTDFLRLLQSTSIGETKVRVVSRGKKSTKKRSIITTLFSKRATKAGDEQATFQHFLESDRSMLHLEVVSIAGLSVRGNQAARSPFVSLTLQSAKHKKKGKRKVTRDFRFVTTTLHDTSEPEWHEAANLLLVEDRDYLIVHVWDYGRFGHNDFLGEVRLPWWEYTENDVHQSSFTLQPAKRKRLSSVLCGDLTLRFSYHNSNAQKQHNSGELSASIEPLMRYLVSPPHLLASALFHSLAAAKAIQTRESTLLLQSVYLLYQHRGFLPTVAMLEEVVAREVEGTAEAAQLFRGNSVATNLLSMYTTSVCGPFLSELLGPLVLRVSKFKRGTEIDPNRVSSDTHSSAAQNQRNLEAFCSAFLDAILAAEHSVPPQLRLVLDLVGRIVEPKFGASGRRICCASLFFLR